MRHIDIEMNVKATLQHVHIILFQWNTTHNGEDLAVWVGWTKRRRGGRKRKKELIIDIIIFEFNPKRRNRAIQYLMNLFYMHDFLWYRWVGAVLSSTLCSALPCTWYAHISIHPINFTMWWNESIIFTMHTNQNDLIGIFHILFRFVWLLLYLTLSLYPSLVHSSCF